MLEKSVEICYEEINKLTIENRKERRKVMNNENSETYDTLVLYNHEEVEKILEKT